MTITAMIASDEDDSILVFRNVVLMEKLGQKIKRSRYTLNTSVISQVKNQTAYILAIAFVAT